MSGCGHADMSICVSLLGEWCFERIVTEYVGSIISNFLCHKLDHSDQF